MRILLTGATGFVGRACVERLAGHDLVAAVRGGSESKPLAASLRAVEVGDIGPTTDWAEALVGVDAVLHVAGRAHVLREPDADAISRFRAVNTEGTRVLAEAAARAGVRRFVFVSSIGVHGRGQAADYKGPGYSPADEPAPRDDYAVSKLEAERILLPMKEIGPVVVRPPLVYGPNVPGNLRTLLGLIRRGLPLPFQGVRNRRSMIGVRNLADLLAITLEHPSAAGEIFNVADADEVSTPEIVRALATGLGRPARLFPLPSGLVGGLARLARKEKMYEQLFGSFVVDGSRARDLLAWTPPQSIQDGLVECGRSYAEARAQG
ncbi:NAD-dependent epimerase/dehydratase family protein [Fimbriimonas ginsengisoli]|uniref:Putative NAD dependent epimerase/dehydratase family n=1 Tax=Fimbriimonas ginsengisoli Gsoil 348 TaxID=661478 RepID=A0A068NV52_FIMGI|nr:NAD-dependent epimerase/dehydratase family protein [Fimbriimonas ginsengisoli]AIE86630.1 putative NAD dependent epimerase/dehydratase family [Fimbriimonas ginsengisoli Gsoil 348]